MTFVALSMFLYILKVIENSEYRMGIPALGGDGNASDVKTEAEPALCRYRDVWEDEEEDLS